MMDITIKAAVIIPVEDRIFTSTKESWSSWEQPKSLLICFCNTDQIIYNEFVPSGQTITGELYHSVLRWLRENVKEMSRHWVLHHNNVRAHAAFMVQQFLVKKKHANCFSSTVFVWLGFVWLISFPSWKLRYKANIDMIEKI